jgi:MFS family permease
VANTRAVPTLCLVQFVDVLGVTVVVTALPAMLRSFHASTSGGTLIVAGYAMCFGGLLMTGARLGDRYGHRRAILASLVVYACGGLTGAVANSVPMLSAARCLQGASAAAAVPAALRLLTTLSADGAPRHRAMAAWSATGAAAGASGFVVGGGLTQLSGWRASFWVNIGCAALLAIAVLRSVPADQHTGRSIPLDLPGSATLTAAVMAVILATSLIGDAGRRPSGLALLATGGALAGLFALVERRAAGPLLPGAAVRSATLRAGSGAAFLNTATTSSAMTLVTLYLQDHVGQTPLQAGASLLPFSLAVIGGAALAPPTLRRLGPRLTVSAGLIVIAATDAALAAAAGPATVPITVALGGCGIGLSSVAATTLAIAVKPELRGTASGIVNTAAQLGTAVGVAALLLVAEIASQTLAWACAAGIALAGALRYVSSANSARSSIWSASCRPSRSRVPTRALSRRRIR